MLESGLAAGVAEAGGDALARRRAAHPGRFDPRPAARAGPRGGRLRLAQPVAGQRDQVLRRRWPQARRRARGEIEARPADRRRGSSAGGDGIGRVRELEGGLADYLRELERSFRLDLSGRRIVLDCANGSTYRAAPAIFGGSAPTSRRSPRARTGTTSTWLRIDPSRGLDRAGEGERRRRSGSRSTATATGCWRWTPTGCVRDGDELIALSATHLAGAGRLGGGVAVTVMSNYGFHKAMAAAGIEVATTPVGDRASSAELESRSWGFGGEQSGHLIWTDFAPTGDGIAAALLTLEALGGTDLAEARPIERLPQVLENVRVADRDAVAAGTSALGSGRARERGARGPRTGSRPPLRHRAADPGDGRGTRARRGEAVCARLVALIKREPA